MNKYMYISILSFLLLATGCATEELPITFEAKLLSTTDRSMLAYMDSGEIRNSRHQVIARFENDTLTNTQKQTLGFSVGNRLFTMTEQELGLVTNTTVQNTAGQTIASVEGNNLNDKAGLAIAMFIFFLND
ncbi:hypothetical protein A3SI_16550 [Nitritalea halalkaliphila LW7]|uniref:Lipoprotein n=1 Tax=Nitritalea halalkaliphila LW7 TaxID=1189621 RepID=I5BX18_9BACT|nr:hypothetical protein [Nitritalea halalkaliphila]EIM74120.1 hypothetical protein A3SI_16550 [Nitritalea halalkaliphila LW7]